MKANLLEKAVKTPTNVLKPVVDVAWAMIPVPKHEVVQIAIDTNKALGYELFDDLYYPRLIVHFSMVARAVANNAIKERGEH